MANVRIALEIEAPDLGALSQTILQPLIDTMQDEIGIVERMFDRVTRTWEPSHQPTWERKVDLRKGRDPVLSIFTTSTPFVWVSGGHSGGRVAFSSDYRSRTRKRVLGSRARRGRVVARGRKAPRKRPVEAREFEMEIADRRNEPNKFPKKMQKALNKGARRALGIRRKKKKSVEL